MNTNKEITLSLEELKGMVNTTTAYEVAPTAHNVRESGSPVVAAHVFSDGDQLTAYKNGFAVYQNDRHRVVLRIDRCGSYIYKTNREEIHFSEDYFDKLPWTVRLQMEAEDQIALNQKTRGLPTVSDKAADIDEIARLEEKMDAKLRLKDAMAVLNARQKEIVILYYSEDRSSEEIAKRLHITPNAVDAALVRIRKHLKKYL